MATSSGDSRSVLDDPLKAPAIGMTDRLHDDDSPLESPSMDASATKDHHAGQDASSLNQEGGGHDPSANEENEWEDLDDEENLSLYEEMLDATDHEGGEMDQVVGAFAPEEAQAIRQRLRLIGQDRFIRETLESGLFSAKKLCTAFGARIPFFLEGSPDEAYYGLLSVCIARELQKRVKLPQWNTVEDAVELLKGAKNVVVLTGAGISTSLGIPDFRSKDTGLYAQLEHLGLSDPQEVFDIHLFREDPSIFYSVAKDILPSSKRYTPTHAFIRLLQDKGKLLTNFTQNIDNLEEWAGIVKEKLVQCHGSFATATCIQCKHTVECKVIYKDLKAGQVARCEKCLERIQRLKKPGLKRKRSSDVSNSTSKKKKKGHSYDDEYNDDNDEEEHDDVAVAGVMKPDITFFGEGLPARFHDRLIHHDRELVDLVVIIGTSLKVAPVSEVVGVIPAEVPQIYISREACNHNEFDIDLLGDCDTVVTELCRRAGWDLNHEMVKDGPIGVQLKDGFASRFLIKPGAKDQPSSNAEGEANVEKQVDALFDALKQSEHESGANEGSSPPPAAEVEGNVEQQGTDPKQSEDASNVQRTRTFAPLNITFLKQNGKVVVDGNNGGHIDAQSEHNEPAPIEKESSSQRNVQFAEQEVQKLAKKARTDVAPPGKEPMTEEQTKSWREWKEYMLKDGIYEAAKVFDEPAPEIEPLTEEQTKA